RPNERNPGLAAFHNPSGPQENQDREWLKLVAKVERPVARDLNCFQATRILFAHMAVVIIPAAGLGTRMAPLGKDKKPAATKQFVELHGVPVVVHTVRQFAANPEISEIFVALRK